MLDSIDASGGGNYGPVVNTLRAALSLDSTYYEASYQIGILYFKAKNYEAAIKEFERTIQLHPSHDKAMVYLGILYYALVDEQKACSFFHKAIQLGNKEAGEYAKRYCNY